jgi:hypothetical protein
MTDFMLDEWLKPGYEPQKKNQIIIIDGRNNIRIGYLACTPDVSITGHSSIRWHVHDTYGDWTPFYEDEIESANSETGIIKLFERETRR